MEMENGQWKTKKKVNWGASGLFVPPFEMNHIFPRCYRTRRVSFQKTGHNFHKTMTLGKVGIARFGANTITAQMPNINFVI